MLKIEISQPVSKRIIILWLLTVVGLTLSACTTQSQTATPTNPTQTPIAAPTATPTSPPPPTKTAPLPTPFTLEETLSTVGYSLPLTIQHVTETKAILFFKLDTPAEGKLFYWPVGEEETLSEFSFPKTASRQQITLEGLTPGTEYQAVVGISTGEGSYQQPYYLSKEKEWGAINFHTASDSLPLRVGIVGDSGLGEQITMDLAEQMASYDLDFVLHAGDLVYLMELNSTPFEAYALKYYIPFASLLHEMPVYPVVGNHDVEPAARWQDNTPFYYYVFPSFTSPDFDPSDYETRNQWYSFAYGSFQFLMLDTQAFFSEEGRAEQDAWLEERLADDCFRYTIPVFHVPAYASGQRPEEYRVVRLSWDALFQEANVPVVFSGHEHFYERLSVNDITYIVTGGGSSVLYDLKERQAESQFFARQTHFTLMEIYTDRIELSAITEEGEIIDQATIPLD